VWWATAMASVGLQVVFVPYWARGHVSPMLVVAAELARRGVPVGMVVDQRYAESVRRAGVVAVTASGAHEPRVPAGWSPAGVADRARAAWQRWRAARDTTAVSRRLMDAAQPALMVLDPHTRCARQLELRGGTRRAWLWTTVPPPTWLRVTPRCEVLVNALPALWRPGRVPAGVRFVGPLLGGLRTPDPGIPWCRIAAADRLLVVSTGSVFAPSSAFLARVAADFARSRWLVVLASGRTTIGASTLPDNVLSYPWIPQAALLRHADVLLTHGGMNSVLEAVDAGVPMLVRPRRAEQRATADRVVDLGWGRVLPRDGNLRAAAESLVGDGETARRLSVARRGFDRGASRRAAETLLRLADLSWPD
jgi:UDP:flavonoid glycosyltransferase YjiC (YdhE family)